MTMKNLKEKFKRKINFVKPLYRKVNPKAKPLINTRNENITVNVDNNIKLHGHGIDIKRNVSKEISDANILPRVSNIEKYNISIPGTCQKTVKNISTRSKFTVRNVNVKRFENSAKMLGIVEAENTLGKEYITKSGDQSENKVFVHKLPDTWLRVYPAPKLPKESIFSVAFRWFMCQLGLSTFLVLWTLAWIAVIQHFEGPFEKKVSKDFQNEQNQLVIDLATELRQITPLSPKWRNAIEDRIESERQLTIAAVAKGARLHPGHFWDMPGTFLFMIYVMTALGFGAPVPQTLWGRTATLIYAAVSIPAHIYLMVHLSTCIVVRLEHYIDRVTLCFSEKTSFEVGKNAVGNTNGSPNCSRNSELIKLNRSNRLRRRLVCILSVFCAGRGVPLATVLYYVLGVATFGLARSKPPLEVVMFPLEFTTTGGLEHVECYVRFLYGVYVEGAMVLLSCGLATLRRHSSGPVDKMTEKYRLFISENCDNCHQ